MELRRISCETFNMRSSRLALATAVLAIAIAGTRSAHAQTLTVLYSFTGGTDGGAPVAGLVRDGQGNLYGTTSSGGRRIVRLPQACGTVFKLDTAGNETVLHSFGETGRDGQVPYYGYLVRDGAGNLYGTTSYGGAHGAGTIFRVSATVGKRWSFPSAGANGGFPFAGLVADAAGNFYGTTYVRGSGCPPYGCGTVFEVTSKGKETVLHSFMGAPDGDYPLAGLVRDSAGNLYGTTARRFRRRHRIQTDPGGQKLCYTLLPAEPTGDFLSVWCGQRRKPIRHYLGGRYVRGRTVFKVDASGKETVLYAFCSQSACTDGSQPSPGWCVTVRETYTAQPWGAAQSAERFSGQLAGKETVLTVSFTVRGPKANFLTLVWLGTAAAISTVLHQTSALTLGARSSR